MLIQRSFCDPFWQAWIKGKKVLLLFYTYFPFWNFFWVVVGCLPWPWGLNFGFPTYSFDHEKAFDKWCRLLRRVTIKLTYQWMAYQSSLHIHRKNLLKDPSRVMNCTMHVEKQVAKCGNRERKKEKRKNQSWFWSNFLFYVGQASSHQP